MDALLLFKQLWKKHLVRTVKWGNISAVPQFQVVQLPFHVKNNMPEKSDFNIFVYLRDWITNINSISLWEL